MEIEMFSDRLFPTSDPERTQAINAPRSFWMSAFLRHAAALALVQTVWVVLWPSTTFESPGIRLYSVMAFGFFMATAADVPEICGAGAAIRRRSARPRCAASLNKAPTSIVNSTLTLFF